MKNIQIIDGAENCSYAIFAATDAEFAQIFPSLGQNVEFIEDLASRIGERNISILMSPIWSRPIPKADANGIHGTLFYGLLFKSKFYPTKKEEEMIVVL